MFALFANRPGVFLDVGANAGMSALSFRIFDRTRPIVSIEPNPHHRADLRFAQRLARPMTFHILAAAAEERSLTLYVPVYRGVALTAEASIYRNSVVRSPGLRDSLGARMESGDFSIAEHAVRARPLDALSLDPAVVKIDVQGAECDALLGMQGTIRRSQPAMLIEAPPLEARELLGQLGYRPFTYHAGSGRIVHEIPQQINTVFLHERDWHLVSVA